MAGLVDVFNIALSANKSPRVADPLTDSRAAVCRDAWTGIRQAALRAHPWNCALRRKALPALAAAPAWGWAVQYQLPVDPWCLRVHRIEGEPDFAIEGRLLLSDAAGPLNVLYIADVTDVAEWDALLVRYAGLLLGVEICPALSGDTKLQVAIEARAERALRDARSIDGQEGTPEAPVAFDWELERL